MSIDFDNFDLTNEFNILRIVCGLFFIPHTMGKIYEPAVLQFFVKANFKPPAAWMYLSGLIEVVLAIGLILGVFVPYVATLAAIHLMVAAIALYRVSKGKWIWNAGGCEFPVFWAICCVVVAMHG
jgi:putative oxidoreductase